MLHYIHLMEWSKKSKLIIKSLPVCPAMDMNNDKPKSILNHIFMLFSKENEKIIWNFVKYFLILELRETAPATTFISQDGEWI